MSKNLFGKIATELNFLTPEQLEKCLRIQDEMEERGEERIPIGEIMLSEGYITPECIHEILRKQKALQLQCSKCLSEFKVDEFNKTEKLRCKKCQNILIIAPEVSVSETPQCVKIDIDGKIVNAILTGRKISETISKIIDQGKYKIAIDITDIPYTNKEDFMLFFSHLENLFEKNGLICFLCGNEEVRKVLKELGLAKIIQIFSSEDELKTTGKEIFTQRVKKFEKEEDIISYFKALYKSDDVVLTVKDPQRIEIKIRKEGKLLYSSYAKKYRDIYYVKTKGD